MVAKFRKLAQLPRIGSLQSSNLRIAVIFRPT